MTKTNKYKNYRVWYSNASAILVYAIDNLDAVRRAKSITDEIFDELVIIRSECLDEIEEDYIP